MVSVGIAEDPDLPIVHQLRWITVRGLLRRFAISPPPYFRMGGFFQHANPPGHPPVGKSMTLPRFRGNRAASAGEANEAELKGVIQQRLYEERSDELI